jgi:hypothetical protein
MMIRRGAFCVLILSMLLVLASACAAKLTPPNQLAAQNGAAKPAGAAIASSQPPAAATPALAIPDGVAVREDGKPDIYVIEQGKRRAFPSFETFVAWGGKADLSNVRVLSAADMAKIPVGETVSAGEQPKPIATSAPPAQPAAASPASQPVAGSLSAQPAAVTGPAAFPDGTFIREDGKPDIYVMEQGKRRAFPTFETFVAWGGKADLSNVRVLSGADLAKIPVGETIVEGSHP